MRPVTVSEPARCIVRTFTHRRRLLSWAVWQTQIRFWTAGLALAILVVPPFAQVRAAQESSTYDRVDAYVSDHLGGVPGAALGIVQYGVVSHVRAFGHADSSGRSVTARTPFVIGSLSRSFTAVAVMRLVGLGKIRLDSPAQKYLPSFRLADTAGASTITVRELLNESSGLPANPALTNAANTSVGARVRALAGERLAARPGQRFAFSDDNYVVLGALVEAVSHQPYPDYVQQHIFAPLKMRDSFTALAAAQADGLAAGHQWWFGRAAQVNLSYRADLVPAKLMASSVQDMTAYAAMHVNGGKLESTRLLSTAGIAELHRPSISMAPQPGQYAMGWSVTNINGVPALEHDGAIGGYRTDVVLVPNSAVGVVFMTNADSLFVSSTASQTAAGVTSMLLGRQPQPFTDVSTKYLVLDGILAVLVVYELWSLARAIGAPGRTRRTSLRGRPPRLVAIAVAGRMLRVVGRLLPVAGRLIVAAGIVALPLFAGKGSSPVAFFTGNDVGVALAVVVVLFLANACLRLWRVRATPLADSLPPRGS